MKAIKAVVAAALLAAGAGVGAEPGGTDLLLQADRQARSEAVALRAAYEEGNRHFQRGEFTAALNTYDYAAWHGSVAAATRLCVLDAYGVGTTPNPLKAAFWCDRAAAAGGNPDLAYVKAYLQNYWVAGK